MWMIKMGWKNPYALGNIALGCDICYDIGSHGSASATYESMANSDIPMYAHGFYFPTENDALTNIKYSRTEIGYDRSLMEIKRAIEGVPLEAYTPQHGPFEDSGSAVPKTGEVIEPIVIKNPERAIVDEILKAQEKAGGKEITLKEMEIEEIIIKRIRKRELKLN
jgi:hypothetical protein